MLIITDVKGKPFMSICISADMKKVQNLVVAPTLCNNCHGSLLFKISVNHS